MIRYTLINLLLTLERTFRFCCLPSCLLQRPEHVSDVDEVVVVTVVVVVVVVFTTVTGGVRFGVHLAFGAVILANVFKV